VDLLLNKSSRGVVGETVHTNTSTNLHTHTTRERVEIGTSKRQRTTRKGGTKTTANASRARVTRGRRKMQRRLRNKIQPITCEQHTKTVKQRTSSGEINSHPYTHMPHTMALVDGCRRFSSYSIPSQSLNLSPATWMVVKKNR
jgi:hypothetical protein